MRAEGLDKLLVESSLGVSGSASRIPNDDCLADEQNQAGEEHVCSDHGWPVEAEVVVPIDGGQNQSREEEQRAYPAPEAR